VKDELREGDQILVKVLSIEGNRIKLSRKAVLREQRAKLGLPEPGQPGSEGIGAEAGSQHARPSQPHEEALPDGEEEGEDFEEDGDEAGEEPNFNRADGAAPVPAGASTGTGPDGQRRSAGRRRRGGRRPGSGNGPQGGGGNRQ
jgi:polyribonucleotide nucleotidyltransferase